MCVSAGKGGGVGGSARRHVVTAARTLTVDELELRDALAEELAPRKVDAIMARLRGKAVPAADAPAYISPEAYAIADRLMRKKGKR